MIVDDSQNYHQLLSTIKQRMIVDDSCSEEVWERIVAYFVSMATHNVDVIN